MLFSLSMLSTVQRHEQFANVANKIRTCHDMSMSVLVLLNFKMSRHTTFPTKVPPVVFQDEAKGKQANAVQETVKEAVLKIDSLSHVFIIALCFDPKTFYTTSQSINELTWMVFEKQVWSHHLNKNVVFKF